MDMRYIFVYPCFKFNIGLARAALHQTLSATVGSPYALALREEREGTAVHDSIALVFRPSLIFATTECVGASRARRRMRAASCRIASIMHPSAMGPAPASHGCVPLQGVCRAVGAQNSRRCDTGAVFCVWRLGGGSASFEVFSFQNRAAPFGLCATSVGS